MYIAIWILGISPIPNGDLNARVGTEHLVWRKVIGQHGMGMKLNHNGLRLLSL